MLLFDFAATLVESHPDGLPGEVVNRCLAKREGKSACGNGLLDEIALSIEVLAITGCESNTGVVAPSEMIAKDKAMLESRQADYSKAMQEAYGKK